MFPYFLALPLPAAIRQRLASLCYGLPHVKWVEEENFHLTLRYLGPLNAQQKEAVLSHLQDLFFHPIHIHIQGMDHFRSRGNQGIIWVGIQALNSSLIELKKEIDRQIQPFNLPKDDRPFQPHITIGRYQGLNAVKLGDYLTSYFNFQSEKIEINECLLLQSRQTTKHVIYEVIETYPAQKNSTFD